jgi:hypothetical protein
MDGLAIPLESQPSLLTTRPGQLPQLVTARSLNSEEALRCEGKDGFSAQRSPGLP